MEKNLAPATGEGEIDSAAGATAAGSASPKPEDDKTKPPPLTSHGPLLLIILVLLSLWIYLYTEFFPVFGSIVGLGGVLIVVPAMRGLMSEDRQKAYTAWFDRLLFQSSVTLYLYCAVFLAIVIIGFGIYQPIRITNTSLDRPINLHYRLVFANGSSGHWAPLYLQPRQTKPKPLRRSSFGGPAAIEFKASGLPSFTQTTSNWLWPSVILPADAWREPIVILRPDADLLEILPVRRPRLRLELHSGGNAEPVSCAETAAWFGLPVWIGGGDGSLSVPPDMLREWKNAHTLALLRKSGQGLDILTSGVTRRPTCTASTGQPLRLLPDDELHFTIATSNGDPVSTGAIKINGDEPFPLELVASPGSSQ